jgi:hypothetical protein
MVKFFKRITIFFLVLTFVAVPWCAIASSDIPDPDNQIAAAAMAGDAVVGRPLGLVSLVLGFGVFVVSSPFSAMGGNIGEAWGTLVVNPAKFTFTRPLGEIDTPQDRY